MGVGQVRCVRQSQDFLIIRICEIPCKMSRLFALRRTFNPLLLD